MDQFLNILMIDDDQDDHDMFRNSLKEVQIDGFKVTEIVKMISVYNGLQALDYLLKRNTYKNNKDPLPDFIVLDLNMPIMDGFEVLGQIRAHKELKQVPVYVLTTSRDAAHKQKCLHLNCAGYFSKPSARIGVRTIIEQMLNVYS
jgi:two-component system response regulator